MSLDHVSCGFVPLTDCAVLVAAQEMGFAAEMGIDLDLQREASWSNIRDKVAVGLYPVAHMLSPMVLAASLGMGPINAQIDAPFVLGVNGNTLTTSRVIGERVRASGGSFNDVEATAKAMLEVFHDRPLRIGVPFPHSMHRLLVSYLFRNLPGGQEISFVTAPPSVLGQVLQAGEVDAFMVGEPWGSLAVEQGDAEILLPSAAIWNAAPEKVLGVRRDWIETNPDLLQRLMKALHRASEWAADPRTTGTLAEILAQSRYLDAPAEVIERALIGQIVLNGAGELGAHRFQIRLGGGTVNFPWRSAAEWIAVQMAPNLGVSEREARDMAKSSFRTDIYRSTIDPEQRFTPPVSSKVEGTLREPAELETEMGQVMIGPDSFFDNVLFDPDVS